MGDNAKEKPILFSGEMVRAILDGRKTQTRRVVKSQPSEGFASIPRKVIEGFCSWGAISPYGQTGDRLWVREAFHVCNGAQRWKDGTIIYRADHGTHIGGLYADLAKWKPSIHMPRWASRITLEITDIGVERLQDISEEDARAEGVLYVPGHGEISLLDLRCDPGYSNYLNCRMGFGELWERINGPGSWDANPWVWKISFARVGK